MCAPYVRPGAAGGGGLFLLLLPAGAGDRASEKSREKFRSVAIHSAYVHTLKSALTWDMGAVCL